jgi:AcrR family transcriptional regulator
MADEFAHSAQQVRDAGAARADRDASAVPAKGDARRVRADAHRNQERLLEVARRAFSAAGDRVTLDGIAREAGVGIGTLYRHFPTREALVEAVHRAGVTRLCDSAGELLATLEPDAALRTWMDRFADYIAAKREMADALRAVVASGAITSSQIRGQMSGAVRLMLDAGAAAGTLRDDVPAVDVVASLVGTFLACGQPDQRDQANRMLDLLMDALRRRGS